MASSAISLNLASSSAAYTLKVKYLHGTNIPSDFTTLYFASMRILNEYYGGGADDDGCEIYGKGDWIANNLGWMQNLGSRSIFNYTSLYSQIYQDNYTIDFAYSPKFNWDTSSPWVSKNFTYGHPNIIHVGTPLKSTAPSSSPSSGKRIIRH